MDHHDAVRAYEQAWTQTVEEKIRHWLEECWTAETTYENPITDTVTGVDAMIRLILDYGVLFPDVMLEWVGDLDEHHMYACRLWRLRSSARVRVLGHDYGHTLHGEDIIEISHQGKISRVVSFFRAPFPQADRLASGTLRGGSRPLDEVGPVAR